MALNGIDAQIMIQRTADYSKDVGNNVRKSELMQEYASTMRKAEEQVKASTVTRQEAPDKVRFSVKKDRQQENASSEDNRGDGDGEKCEDEQESTKSGDGITGEIIDIKI